MMPQLLSLFAKALLSLLAWILLSWASLHPIMAQEIFSDNFDDGDASDWRIVRNYQYAQPSLPCWYGPISGPAQWQVLGGQLGISLWSPPCSVEIVPQNLDLTHVDAYEVEFDWLLSPSTSMDRNMVFLWQDSDHWYDVKLFDNSVLVQKVFDGQTVYGPQNNSAAYTFESGKSYHFKITFDGPAKKIEVSIDGTSVIQATDVFKFVSGYKTLGLKASTGAVSYSVTHFDNIVVRQIESQGTSTLAMTHWKQSDPAWHQQEYDTASKWSAKNPNMYDWGCAVTSAAMILDYHGIRSLPDGSPLNPGSLNSWLKSQPDGYVGSGLTNWQAITRLTQVMSQALNTPKIEYGRVAGSSISTAQTQLAQRQPVMLEVPGHFLVSNGPEGKQDLKILDPFYNYQQLSQHTAGLVSTRTFTPSQTDLSYLLLVHSPYLQLELRDAAGNLVTQAETFVEQLNRASRVTDRSPSTQVTQLAKPNSGEYFVTIHQPTNQPFKLEIWAYDQTATATNLSQTGQLGPDPITFKISYNKNGASSIAEVITFAQLRQLLRNYSAQNMITSQYWYKRLDQVAATGQNLQEKNLLDTSKVQRLALLLWGTMRQAGTHVLPAAQEVLGQRFNRIYQML